MRTGLPAIREDLRDCPAGIAVRTRPLVRQDPRPPRAATPWETFALGPLMTALDRIEHYRLPENLVLDELHGSQGTFGNRSRPVHAGLLAWTTAAVSHWRAAREANLADLRAGGRPVTYPVDEHWVVRDLLREPDDRGAALYERTAWGRRYTSLCGTVRELWLLSLGSAKEDRPDAEIAAAAHVAMFGEPCATARYGSAHEPIPPHLLHPARTARPERVRVIAVGCGDGSSAVLADWDECTTRDRYRRHAAPALARVVSRTARTPASTCAKCPAIAGCHDLHRAPGVLGAPEPPRRRERRTVSVSDLRAHAACPARYHLTRVLHLRSPRPESEAVRRGRAVDDWLNEQHARLPHRPCEHEPGPATPQAWAERGFALGPQASRTASLMIAQHAWTCPLDGLEPDETVSVQHQLAVYDEPLDTIVIATPDLVHTRAGGTVLRETKTASTPPRGDQPLLRRWPQLALSVLLLDAGAVGDPSRSRVELEILYEEDSEVRSIDPALPHVVGEARQVITELAGAWTSDATYTARPGRACADCEALDWCRPGLDHTATQEQRD
ncbi:PD-(D/E)XK nuclease family protein [Streptomyces sp. DSM 116494]|uniref:PD-(D/E)XK nuclease family protein n=1 Tax=Streptomyces okerensis TaxID=3344655 RepID=UPI00388F2D98